MRYCSCVLKVGEVGHVYIPIETLLFQRPVGTKKPVGQLAEMRRIDQRVTYDSFDDLDELDVHDVNSSGDPLSLVYYT